MRIVRCLALILAIGSLVSSAFAVTPKPPAFAAGSWTLVLLPDTQVYAAKYPDIFTSQTSWIANNAKSRNIQFVMTEGDVTNNNSPEQWTRARDSMKLLDGVVPYALELGNHDYSGHAGLENRATLANTYFPPDLVRSSPAYGGVYEKGKLDNAYYLFSAGGRDWVAISLEFAPRNGVVSWANKVLDVYPKRTAIICTHAYLYHDGTRYDSSSGKKQTWSPHDYAKDGVNDGEELWLKLVSKHANVAFVFCGHVLNSGASRLTSKGEKGNKVHQILANYQMREQGGEGYLRLVEFLPDGKTVRVLSYSPYLNKYLTEPDQQFTLDLPPAP